jgi:MOSC domain-containing protein
MSTGTPPPRLASVHIYPVKSGRAVDLAESRVEPWGLAGDRRWLITDGTGRFITQRDESSLALLTAGYTPDGALMLSAPGRPPLAVPAPEQRRGAEMVTVTVRSSAVLAAAAGGQADAWLSRFLGRTVRLMYLDDPARRSVDPEFGEPGDRVSFADGYPLLVTTTRSLDALGRWLEQDGHPPVPMTRFRPNAVVDGTPAWAEDSWRRIQIGTVTFRVVKPCGRCVVTTIDQDTGQRGKQPLAMLGRRRRFGQRLVFGQNIIPDQPGIIRAGDAVRVLEEAPGLSVNGHAQVHEDGGIRRRHLTRQAWPGVPCHPGWRRRPPTDPGRWPRLIPLACVTPPLFGGPPSLACVLARLGCVPVPQSCVLAPLADVLAPLGCVPVPLACVPAPCAAAG